MPYYHSNTSKMYCNHILNHCESVVSLCYVAVNYCDYLNLDHSCNKYCDLIGQCKVSISHINL